MSRWMPDLDLSFSASFISSKEGEKPVVRRCRSMKISSSCCLRVSTGRLRTSRDVRARDGRNKPATVNRVLRKFSAGVKCFPRLPKRTTAQTPSSPSGMISTASPTAAGRRVRRAQHQRVGPGQGLQHGAVLHRKGRGDGCRPAPFPGARADDRSGGRSRAARRRAAPGPCAAPPPRQAGQTAQRRQQEHDAADQRRDRDCPAGRAPASAPSRPQISGLPGRMAICQKSSASPPGRARSAPGRARRRWRRRW